MRIVGMLCLCLWALVGGAQPVLEEVLVTGVQPGPGLWKVTRADDSDGHVLWLLGSHSPLPKKLRWRSSEVESVLAGSQALLAPPSVDASVGPLGGVTLLPALIGARRNPSGQRLEQVLPPELHGRWLPLKARYLGKDDDIEAWRPLFAAQALYLAALRERELVPYEGVWPAVEKRARRLKVPIVRPQLELKVERPRAAIKEFKRTPLDDVECFARTIRRLESDLDLMHERARAWAVGDVARLRALAPAERASACIGALLESGVARERGYADVFERTRGVWLRAAEEALARNASTLAVVPMDEWLRPDGLLERLQRKGYRIEEP